MRQQLFSGTVGVQSQGSVAAHEPGLPLTSQGGAQDTSWVGREAPPGPRGDGHSDAALSSREGGKALCLWPHSFLWENNKAILCCLTHTTVTGAPGGRGKSTLAHAWLWGRKRELSVRYHIATPDPSML